MSALNDESQSPTPEEVAALELVDAALVVEGLNSPQDERALTDLLTKAEGIHDFSFANGKVLVEYDPVRINQRRLAAAIEQAGYCVGEVETSIASPIGDALHD